MGLLAEMKQYFIHEKVDFIDDEEASADFQDLDDQDVDNDGDVDNSDSYLHKRLGTIAKMDENQLGVEEPYYIEVAVRDARNAQLVIGDRRDLKGQYKMYGSNVYASDDEDIIAAIKDAFDAVDIEILDSITEESTTANVPGYQTPYAFRKDEKPASEIEILGYKKAPKTNKYFRPMESKSTYKQMMSEMYGLKEAVKYDILAALKNIKAWNNNEYSGKDYGIETRPLDQLAIDIIKNLGYKVTGGNVDDVVDHLGNSMGFNDKIPVDEDLVKELYPILNGTVNESMTLDQAKKEALEDSKNGYVQHVNKISTGYEVSDWYDDKTTVASYENGRAINEARMLESVSYRQYKKDESSTPSSNPEMDKLVTAFVDKIADRNGYPTSEAIIAIFKALKRKGFLHKSVEYKSPSGYSIDEAVSYRQYKKDESSTPSKKVNQSIMEVNKMLAEIEKIVHNNIRLKTEMGVNSSQFWKSTGIRFTKINERMTRLSNKLKELSK